MFSSLSSLSGRCFSRAIFYVVGAGIVLAFFVAYAAHAQIFQFSHDDPRYTAALAVAAAQEAEKELNIEEKISLDEDFTPEDFGLEGDVGLLPTNPFYFFKGIRRGVQSFFTFDPVEKAELKLDFAAEKLLEAKELAKLKGVDEAAVTDALDNFRGELERVKDRVGRAKGGASEEEALRMAKKLMDSTFKYEKSLGKFEKDLSPGAFEHIKGIKDNNSETFAKVFDLLESEKASEELAKVLDEQKGSEFKHFKNVEVLKEVGERVPEDARDAIHRAEENALSRLHAQLEQFDKAKKAVFEDFIKEIGGNEVRHLEIINELEVRPLSEDLRRAILGAKEEAISRAENRLMKFERPEQKERYVEHLANGSLEDIRIFKELENNVGAGVVQGIFAVKQKAENNFKKNIGEIDTDENKKKEFFSSIEQFHDAKSIAVLDEIEGLIPEDKKEFFKDLKKKAAEEIKSDIGRARNESQKKNIFNALAGDHPDEFASFRNFEKEFTAPFDAKNIFNGIIEAHFRKIQDRADHIRDEDRFRQYEEAFKGQEEVFRGAPVNYTQTRNFFEDKRGTFGAPDRALAKIETAQKITDELRALADSLPFDTSFKKGQFDPNVSEIERLLELANRKLDTARTSLEYKDTGRAFGLAQAAESIAEEGIRFAKDYKSGKKRVEQRPEFLPPEFFETIRIQEGGEPFIKPVRPAGVYELYNEFEFNDFCAYTHGFRKAPLLCAFPDGRVFDATAGKFPVKIPPEFIPQHQSVIIQEAREGTPRQQVTCPLIFSPPNNFCTDGIVVQNRDQNGCPLPWRCEARRDYTQPSSCPAAPADACPSGSYRETYKGNDGCPSYGSCISSGGNVCGGIAGIVCPHGSICKLPQGTPGALGTCVEDTSRVTCQAYFEGHIYDSFSRTCKFASQSGCSDPFVYHTREECEIGNGLRQKTICPALPTVDFCPAGQKKVISYSTPECGTYYSCISETEPVKGYCGDKVCGGSETVPSCPVDCESVAVCNYNKICDSNESYTSCPGDCRGTSTNNWRSQTWTFIDGTTQSQILNRTDPEFYSFISNVEAQCKKISKSKFVWKPGAGDDRPENWQNFGIPDCSGTATNYICGNYVCDPGETSAMCAVDCGGTTTGYCGDKICNGAETSASCSVDCGGITSRCVYYSESTCNADLICKWVTGKGCGSKAQCNDGIDNDKDGLIDYPNDPGCVDHFADYEGPSAGYCGDKFCNGSETAASCSVDCGTIGGYCGDKICNNGETATSCLSDCGGTTVYQCSDGKDNDGDGQIDYPADTGCYTKEDNTETMDGTTGGYCGDKVCNSTESVSSCPTDCGTGTFTCNNNKVCESNENYTSCPGDCGGTTACSAGRHQETFGSKQVCVKDGAVCPSTSSWISQCPAGEFNYTNYDSSGFNTGCPTGCYAPTCSGDTFSCKTITGCGWDTLKQSCVIANNPVCGDKICNNNETNSTCPTDCGTGTFTCNNNKVCESNENYTSCPGDCGGTTTGTCSNTPSYCTTQTACTGSGYYWCSGNNLCYSSSSSCPSTTPPPPPPTSSCGTYITEATCNGNTACYWYLGTCSTKQTCSTTYSMCYNQTDCTAAGFSWCASANACYGAPGACPTTCGGFTYSEWGACQSSNTQTRTTLTSTPSGCTGGTPPLLTQSCTYTAPPPPPPPAFSCTTSYGMCYTQAECTGAGWVWCPGDTMCHSSAYVCPSTSPPPPPPPPPSTSTCGNAVCESGETHTSCSADCH